MAVRFSRRYTRPLACSLVLAGLLLLLVPVAHAKDGQRPPAGEMFTPISLTLDEGATVKRFRTFEERPDPEKLGPPIAEAPIPTPGWTTILSEDVEGAFPGAWSTFDNNPASGNDFWDDVSCRSFSGNWSAWCADIGNVDCTTYDNDMSSWMIWGPFSLADALDARAEFRIWNETEGPPFDFPSWLASTNGTNFFGFQLNQDVGWTGIEFDLTSVPSLGDLRGQPAVWLAFTFTSDASVSAFEGTYLDDILIEKLVGGGCTPSSTVLCLPGSNRFRVSVFFDTVLGGGNSGNAIAIPTDPIGVNQGGIFAFTNPSNPEFLVKILNGCTINNRWWVFYAATTNVGFELRVTDTQTNTTRVYVNPDINPANAVTDTQAFATCP